MFTAVLAGLVFAAAFPNPFHKDFVPHAGLLVAAGAAFFLAEIPRGFFAGFRRGFLTGNVWFFMLLYWVAGIHEAGPAVAIPGYLFLALYCSLYPALLLGLLAWAFPGRGAEARLTAPFLWAALEWTRTSLFTGFPWGVLAQAMAGDRAWLPPLAVAGPYGPAFLAVLAGALAASFFGIRGPRSSSLPAWLAGGSTLFLLVGGLQALDPAPSGPPRRVALLQGAVGQDVKWTEENKLSNLLIYGALQSRAAAEKPKPELVVWPEASSTVAFELEPQYRLRLQKDIVDKSGIPTVLGAPYCLDRAKGVFTNSAQLWLPKKGKAAHYDKVHLVPLGEYVPLAASWAWLRKVARGGGAGDFAAGPGPRLFQSGGLAFSPSICYEIIFPDLARQSVALGARMIVNLTNDDWYGPTAMPAQHLAFAVLRSVENGVPVARAANTGISALVDPRKGILARSRLGERTSLTGALDEGAQAGTFYTRHGDLFAQACAFLSLLLLGAGRLSRRHPEARP